MAVVSDVHGHAPRQNGVPVAAHFSLGVHCVCRVVGVKGQVKEDDLINNFVKIVIIIIVYICLLFLFIIIEAHIYQRKVSVVNILSLIMCSKVILKLVSYFNSKPKTKPRTQN